MAYFFSKMNDQPPTSRSPGGRLELRLHGVGVLHGAAALGEGRHRWDALSREAREPTGNPRGTHGEPTAVSMVVGSLGEIMGYSYGVVVREWKMNGIMI